MKTKYCKDVLIDDSSKLGSVFITSETTEKTAIEMCKEFDIELLDDFFNAPY